MCTHADANISHALSTRTRPETPPKAESVSARSTCIGQCAVDMHWSRAHLTRNTHLFALRSRPSFFAHAFAKRTAPMARACVATSVGRPAKYRVCLPTACAMHCMCAKRLNATQTDCPRNLKPFFAPLSTTYFVSIPRHARTCLHKCECVYERRQADIGTMALC